MSKGSRYLIQKYFDLKKSTKVHNEYAQDFVIRKLLLRNTSMTSLQLNLSANNSQDTNIHSNAIFDILTLFSV